MVSGDDPQAAIEALGCLPRELVAEARERLDDDRAGVRAAALACVARLSGRRWLSREWLEAELRHDHEAVRREAVRALGFHQGVAAATVLATALDDPSRVVRVQATSSLAALGEIGLRAVETALRSEGAWTVDAAMGVLAAEGGALARSLLERAFRDQVRTAWRTRVALGWVSDEDALESRFLRMALEDAGTRSRRLAFRGLELLEDPAVVRSLRSSLAGNAPRARADALEVLSNLGDRRGAQLLSLLLEDGALEDKIPFVADSVRLPTSLDDVLRQAGASGDRWLLLAVAGSAGRDNYEERVMEGLLALRKVPLFTHLSLQQLEVISRFVSDAQYLTGEVVVREGDRGDDLYVLMEGEVQAVKNHGTPQQVLLNTLGPVSYFGEMAILDSAPRSATVLVTRDARLLRLAGERFKELVLQAPEIAFELFRVLTKRIRTAEERLGP
jgi:HEAT repeat protein